MNLRSLRSSSRSRFTRWRGVLQRKIISDRIAAALHPFQSIIIVQVEPPRTRVRSIQIEITRICTTLSRRRRHRHKLNIFLYEIIFNLFSFSSKHLTCSRLYNKKKWVEKISKSRNWDLCLWWPLLFCHTRSHSTSFVSTTLNHR